MPSHTPAEKAKNKVVCPPGQHLENGVCVPDVEREKKILTPEKRPEPPPKATTITDERGRVTGIVLPDGTSFLGLPKGEAELIAEKRGVELVSGADVAFERREEERKGKAESILEQKFEEAGVFKEAKVEPIISLVFLGI